MLTRFEVMKIVYILGIAIGFGTASGYPPFDPSVWLACFCLGGLWSTLEIEDRARSKNVD